MISIGAHFLQKSVPRFALKPMNTFCQLFHGKIIYKNKAFEFLTACEAIHRLFVNR